MSAPQGVGEYWIGTLQVIIVNLGNPEIHYCTACELSLDSKRMQLHLEKRHGYNKKAVDAVAAQYAQEVAVQYTKETDRQIMSHVPKGDMVNHPSHYNQGRFEVIDVLEDWKLGFHLGNTVKYIARAGHKGDELEDLKKARWYLDRYIQQLESKLEQDVDKVLYPSTGSTKKCGCCGIPVKEMKIDAKDSEKTR